MPQGLYRFLPDVNAALNATAFLLICAGLLAIERRKETLHKRLMLSATAVSALFLVSYVVYHAKVGTTHYPHQGWIRVVYFSVLWTHTPLAIIQVPLIAMTIVNGLKDRRARHRRLAKITAPIWLYVSLTGVVVYLMLYRI